ncbi:efflux RND transporter permease subunit [bacterium]|nr:efflux RND transporter permease subunit [bacterium]
MKKITSFSVHYPITVLMIVLAVLLLGFISFSKLGVDLFPDLNNPRIFVEVKSGERPPEEMEKQFVDQIETLAIRQTNVTQVSSVSMVGSARITVEYGWNTDMDEAFLDLQKTLTSFSQNGDIDELNITQHDPNASPVILIGFSNPDITNMDELRKIADTYIRNELIRLEGIAEVEVAGDEEEEVEIRTDSYLLEAHGLTVDDVTGKIESYNRNVSGGSIVELGTRYVVKGVGALQSIQDIQNIIVGYTQAGGDQGSASRIPVFLKDVANVRFTNQEPDNIVRVNGKRCLGLSVYKETRYNTIQAVHDLTDALKELGKALPGYEFTIIDNQGEFIQNAVDEVKQTALIGMLLAIGVLFVFLRRVGATAIVSLAIPISIIATFNLMYFNGLSLNIMTLGGLALGAGMLVDNAIVVMENIFRNIEAGMSVKDAAVEGTSQVAGAITASTVTTIVVFLPIVFLHGAAGELFKDQALTVAFALVSSLLVAILVIPMLTTRIIRDKTTVRDIESIRFKWYPDVLRTILAHRWKVIGGAAVLVALSAAALPFIGSEFIPKTESGTFSIELRLPEGTALQRTLETVIEIETLIREKLDGKLETVYSHIGPEAGIAGDENSVFEDENSAIMKITLVPAMRRQTSDVITELSTLLADIPDLDAQFIRDETALQSILGTDEPPLVVEVKGEDLDVLEELTGTIRSRMAEIPDLINLETSFESGAPEIDVKIDRLRAGLFNIQVSSVSSQLADKLSGKDAGQWDYRGELKDLTVRLPEITKNELEDMIIRVGGQQVRLSDIAEITVTNAPREIHRSNQTRVGKITAYMVKGRHFDQVVKQIKEKISEVDFPVDYRADVTGEEQKRQDAMSNLAFALLLSVVLVYMVMASQFESLLHPFTILLTIPLAGVGVVAVFLLLGHSLNIMAYIGIIMLAGIAVNDSIILVDTINRLKEEGLARIDAIVEAGKQRIRPIIMTSLTTILALLPLTLGFGEGAALRSPMALAVIGGLITSTILTLVVIPCVYLTFDELKFRVTGK